MSYVYDYKRLWIFPVFFVFHFNNTHPYCLLRLDSLRQYIKRLRIRQIYLPIFTYMTQRILPISRDFTIIILYFYFAILRFDIKLRIYYDLISTVSHYSCLFTFLRNDQKTIKKDCLFKLEFT